MIFETDDRISIIVAIRTISQNRCVLEFCNIKKKLKIAQQELNSHLKVNTESVTYHHVDSALFEKRQM